MTARPGTAPPKTGPVDLDGPRRPPASGGAPRHLVILLHGLGADGNDLISLAPRFAQVLPDAAFASPHGPFPCDMAPLGRQWFSLQAQTPGPAPPQVPGAFLAGLRAAVPILDTFIARELERHGLGEEDLALLGFSQGAMVALHWGLRRARPCAALLCYSGALVAPEVLAAEITSRPPVLLIHGSADQVVPFGAMAAAETALKTNGVPVRSEVRPELGHGIDETGLRLGAAALETALSP